MSYYIEGKPIRHRGSCFLADKLSWKEREYQSLITKIRTELIKSKEGAVFCYLEDLHGKRVELQLYHEWSKDAYQHFRSVCGSHTIT